MKKKFMLVLAAVMVAIMILACAGAGNASKGESKIKGVYLSPAKADYNNMRPTYNFYLYNFAQSEVTLSVNEKTASLDFYTFGVKTGFSQN